MGTETAYVCNSNRKYLTSLVILWHSNAKHPLNMQSRINYSNTTCHSAMTTCIRCQRTMHIAQFEELVILVSAVTLHLTLIVEPM